MSGEIFISYRREESRWSARLLRDRLSRDFPPKAIFMDIDGIAPGEDFVKTIERGVSRCDVLVAVIGSKWLDSKDGSGNRRLDNPEDFVRIEVGTALKRDIRVIPVLVDDALMPSSTDLPDDLKPLARRNALQITESSLDSDCQRLVDGIKEVWEKSAAEERERLGAELRQREEKQRLEAEQREKEWLEAEEHQREQERLKVAQRLNKPKPFFRLRLIVAKLSVQLTICATIVITSGLILKAFYPGGSEPRPEPPRSISQDGSAFSGALQSEAEEIAKELFAGNYDTVRAKFSAGLSSNLSVQMVQQASQTYIKPLGNLNSTHPQPAKTDPNEQIVVNVICNADKGDLLVTVSFDQQAKVNGLWVKPI